MFKAADFKSDCGFQSRDGMAAALRIVRLCEVNNCQSKEERFVGFLPLCYLNRYFNCETVKRKNLSVNYVKMDGWNALELLRLEEEDRHRRQQRLMRDRRRAIRESVEHFESLTKSAFVKLYRLPQNAVKDIIDEIRDYMPQPWRRSAISVETKVLAALRFFATGSYQAAVGNDMNLGISQSSTSRSIHEVCAAINARLAPRYVQFPQQQQERNTIKERFYAATGFPGVIGAIDCTHVSIVRPREHEDAYINRKGNPTINVQAICDYDMKILAIDASYPGCTGDAHIWRGCAVKAELVRRYGVNQRHEYLLGDSGYASEPWLLTPILNTVPGTPEAFYTDVHCRTRCCVERCFGLLKSRFRCLLQHRTLHYDHRTAAQIINTCATLHNIALELRLPHPEPLHEVELAQEQALDAGDVLPPANLLGDVLAEARGVRNAIVGRLWMANNA